MTTLSLRAFAKRLKVSDTAVRKAVKSGRLSRSVGANAKGQPAIVDEKLARQEWRANAAKSRKDRSSGTLVSAQTTVAVERGRRLQIDNDVRAGRLIDVAAQQKVNFEAAREIREGILNIPARISAELAAETDAAKVYARLDSELRQALSAIADQLKALAAA